MTNQEYLRGPFFGAALPLHRVRALPSNAPRRLEQNSGDFSFLLKLDEIQRSHEPTMEDDDVEFSILENLQSLDRELPHASFNTGFSLDEFERDLDLLAEGLDHLPLKYQGTYSREDIYLDDE